ncbi:MAG: DNA-directed RNA polymerase subunit omega [Verrucomicrobiota bacterium]|nr:DNA-directed RNA polymerase subunit omega [Verrucomicrobiota bacterium]
MKNEYLERAKEKIENPETIITIASKRASELAKRYKPLVRIAPDDENNYLDIALLEIAEGKITVKE